MRLFIAEKPELGRVIAEAIGIQERKNGYIVCHGGNTVTWGFGHILKQADPESYNPDYKKWDLAALPLQIRPFKMEVMEDKAAQFKTIQSLIKQADTVVNAGDPDAEGQLLVDEILHYCHYQGKEERILINDLNVEAVKKALKDIRPNTDFKGLYNKALARSQADFLYGINLTRAYSKAAEKRGVKEILSVGRVQTPILGLVVRRYLANKNHAESFYYTVTGDFEGINARLITTDAMPVDDKIRIIDQAFAESVVSHCQGQSAQILASQVQSKKAAAPLPFSLLKLQALMNRKHGYSSDKVLEITQSLREKHKAITYNRSDCRYLSTEQFEQAPETLNAISGAFSDLAQAFKQANPQQKSKAFNDSKVTAHTAIIPTPKTVDLSQFSEEEKNVYRAIVEQYLIQFLPPKEFDVATVEFSVADYKFKTSAAKVTALGWTAVRKEAEEEESDVGEDNGDFTALSALSEGATIDCLDAEAQKQKNKPPALYSEASLLEDLQRVAVYVTDPKIKQLLLAKDAHSADEKGGIGTPATRSTMIKTLKDRGFITEDKKKLIPTEKGLEFFNALPTLATSPDLTALWHEQQDLIEQGKLSVDEFLDDTEKFIVEQIELAKGVKLENLEDKATGNPCSCGNGFLTLKGKKGSEFFGCSNYPTCKVTKAALNGEMLPDCPCCGSALRSNDYGVFCSNDDCLKLFRKVAGKALTDTQLLLLLTKGKTAQIKGFVGKTGKPFEAILQLNKSAKKVDFIFNK